MFQNAVLAREQNFPVDRADRGDQEQLSATGLKKPLHGDTVIVLPERDSRPTAILGRRSPRGRLFFASHEEGREDEPG
jgi:hypothetical protein